MRRIGGLKFVTGLNIDPIKFNSVDDDAPGGIYFTNLSNVPKWLSYGSRAMIHIRQVAIPPDATVREECFKFKTDRFVLGEKMHLHKFLASGMITHKMILDAITLFPDHLAYLPDEVITEDICLTAVKNKGRALQYVPPNFKTMEICSAAVTSDGLVVAFVPRELLNEKICLLAIRQNCDAYHLIPERMINIKLKIASASSAMIKILGNKTIFNIFN